MISEKDVVNFYTIEDICDILHIGKTSAYKLVNTGRLPAIKVNRLWLISEDDLDKYIASFTRYKTQ